MLLDLSIRVFLITEDPAVTLLTTEEMTGTEGVGAMTTTTLGAADMEEAMIEIDAIDAAGQGAEVTAVVEAGVPVLNIGAAVVEAVPEIDLDVIVIQGVVPRIVIRIGMRMRLTEWVRCRECTHHLLPRHRLVVRTCQCRWDNKCKDFSRDK